MPEGFGVRATPSGAGVEAPRPDVQTHSYRASKMLMDADRLAVAAEAGYTVAAGVMLASPGR
jgi:hypothetical protein